MVKLVGEEMTERTVFVLLLGEFVRCSGRGEKGVLEREGSDMKGCSKAIIFVEGIEKKRCECAEVGDGEKVET